MPVEVVQDGASDTGPWVPARLTRVALSLVSAATDCTDKTVKGKVVHKGPLVSLDDDDFILKTVIQDEGPWQNLPPEHTSINILLFGSIAKDFSESVNQGDVVTMAGFTVGRSPTVSRDKLHPCNLLLSGDDAFVYVSRSMAPDPRASGVQGTQRSPRHATQKTPPHTNQRSPPHATKVSSSKVPKYTYVPLSDLKPGLVVNVYAVVIFFKQPFKTRGTDYCSTLKLTDQSNEKVPCTIFCDKLDHHPKIFKLGDIIRLHRVKAQLFNGSISLITSHGFSVVTFDGAAGSAVVPRAASKTFYYGQEDQQAVEELRSWAAGRDALPPQCSLPLSGVQPAAYFDLTCQLLAKAPIDARCTLLKVWDGTRCAHPLLNVSVEPGTMEGCCTLSKDCKNLTANVLVYDNHIEAAEQLKPGVYLRIYNLHAVPGAGKVPGVTPAGCPEEEHRLAFHLHTGTSYGRGIRVLPEDSLDVQELKRVVESCPGVNDISELHDSALMEIWGTPPESLDSAAVESATERTCSHSMEPVTLAQVKQADPPGLFHVHAQLQSYQPRRLYQSLKLYCPECRTMREVPDDDSVGGVFSEALKDYGPCQDQWAVPKQLDLPRASPSGPDRSLTLYLSSQLMAEGNPRDLVFLMGSTLEETFRVADGLPNIVPVRSSQGSMTLLDLNAPFLFRGTKRYYGCKQCSNVNITGQFDEGAEATDEKLLAEALGVRPMRYSMTMRMELRDGTDTLDALLHQDADSFFHVSAEEVAVDQKAQDRIQQTMDKLCRPGSSVAERPWLDLCLHAYRVDQDGQSQVCYQICQTRTLPPEPSPGARCPGMTAEGAHLERVVESFFTAKI